MSALYIATEFLHVWYLASAAFSFLVGLGVTFALQKFWTFRRTEGSTHMQFASYTGIALVSLLLDVTLLYIFVQWLNLWYMFAQGIALGIIALGSYLANRYYTFSRL
jgi:putative flippase GtrA